MKMRFLLMVFCAVLLAARSGIAGEPEPVGKRDWWTEINKAAESCHGGWDINVGVSTGYGMRTLGDQARTGPFAEARLTVPLYSKRDRQRQAREKGQFLEHAAEVIRELEEAEARILVKQEQGEVLKQVMIQRGLEGIEAYFKIREEVVTLEAKVRAAEMKLQGIVEACRGKKNVAETRTDHR